MTTPKSASRRGGGGGGCGGGSDGVVDITKQSPAKKVTLKLNVKDQDLVDGKYRKKSSRAKPLTLTPKSVKSSKSASAGRRQNRKRPKRAGGVDAAEIGVLGEVYVSDEEEERGSEYGIRGGGRCREFEPPSFTRFRPVSLLTFPVMVEDMSGRRQRWGQSQPPTHADGGRRGMIKTSEPVPTVYVEKQKRCACCGDAAPPEGSSCQSQRPDWSTSDPVLPFPVLPDTITPRSLVSAADIELSRSKTSRPPWEILNLRPTRHVNPETLSMTELVVTRSGPMPNTAEFWYDMAIGEMAGGTDDIDFKMLCLNLMRWRRENDVAAAGLARVRCDHSAEIDEEGLRANWDDVVSSAVARGKTWRIIRRRREGECEKAAGWAVWEGRQRRGSRGEFVEDRNGAWVLRAPGEDGAVRRALRLGYRRRAKSDTVQEDQNGDPALRGIQGGDDGTPSDQGCHVATQ